MLKSILCMKFSRYHHLSCRGTPSFRSYFVTSTLHYAVKLKSITLLLMFCNFPCHFTLYKCFVTNGDGEIRTLDPLLARQVLSQLSYTPIWILYSVSTAFRLMGLSGLEPPTSRLSGVRSNRLSYKPINLASTYFPIPSPV